MHQANSIRQSTLGRSVRVLRGAAASILLLATYTFGTSAARATEPALRGSEPAPEATAQGADPCGSQPPTAPRDPASDSSESAEPNLLVENRQLRCQLREHSSFVRELTRLVAADGASSTELLDQVRWLSQLKRELEQSAQNYGAPLAGSPPSTPQTLLQELTRLRGDQASREQDLASARSRLAERERALTKAMPEIARVLAYQRELKELRADAARAQTCPSPSPSDTVVFRYGRKDFRADRNGAGRP